MASFPTSVISLSNPASNTPMPGVHRPLHTTLNQEVTAIGAWGSDISSFTAFTPGALTQGGGSIAYSTSWAYYRRFGKMVAVDLAIGVTGTGSSGSAITLQLPSTPFTWHSYNAALLVPAMGSFWIVDASGPTAYLGLVMLFPDSHGLGFMYSANGTTMGASFGLASGDSIEAHFLAEVA